MPFKTVRTEYVPVLQATFHEFEHDTGAKHIHFACEDDHNSFAAIIPDVPTDETGAPHQVVLAGLDARGARLLIGTQETRVPVAELADYWFGEFLVLWRPQTGDLRPLRAGMRGEDVRWLRHGLEQLSGLPASAGSGDLFDSELERLVEDFQRSRRLAVDGVAGLQTLMVLDSALGAPGTPTLAGGPRESGA